MELNEHTEAVLLWHGTETTVTLSETRFFGPDDAAEGGVSVSFSGDRIGSGRVDLLMDEEGSLFVQRGELSDEAIFGVFLALLSSARDYDCARYFGERWDLITRLHELRDLLRESTPGEWRAERDVRDGEIVGFDVMGDDVVVGCEGIVSCESDAKLIAAARNILPDILRLFSPFLGPEGT